MKSTIWFGRLPESDLATISTQILAAGLFLLFAGGIAPSLAQQEQLPTDSRVLVQSDGSVVVRTNALSARWPADGEEPGVLYSFGLPSKAPQQRWLEDNTTPIFQTQWNEEGIDYTQRILITSLATNYTAALNPGTDEAVVLVEIAGHNTASEYMPARATFEVKRGNRALELELRDGLVFASGVKEPVAALDVAGEGIGSTNGVRLLFRGDMPPGISGSMTIKIPLAPPGSQEVINRLLDLEFDEELRRVKRVWKGQSQAGAPAFPLSWAEIPK